jgi:hypothetical protein
MNRSLNQRFFPGALVSILAALALLGASALRAAAPGRNADGAAFTFDRGVVVAHWLGRNMPPDDSADSYAYAADWFDEEDVAWIAAQGFDHMRVHVDGHRWIDADGKALEEQIAPFDRLLGWARKHRLGIVLDMTSLPGFRDLPWPPTDWPANAPSPLSDDKLRADAQRLWRLVAKRYATIGTELRFETLNGPGYAADVAQLSAFHQTMLAAIRESSPTRIVYLAPRGGSPQNVGDMALPDQHTILSLEFFEPRVFTQQYMPDLPLVAFPGKVADLSVFAEQNPQLREMSGKMLTVADLDATVARIAAWANAQPRKPQISISEFGVYQRADDASARAYIRAARAAFERHGFSWCVYDYESGMAVRTRDGKSTRILEALDLRGR